MQLLEAKSLQFDLPADLGDGPPAGTRVLVYYYAGCSRCRWCAEGLENLCRTPAAKWGFDTDGGFAQYLAVPSRCLVTLPGSVSFEEAAVLGCAGTTAVHVVDTVATVSAGDVVVVLGAGGVGLAAVQVAVARKALVFAVDPDPGSRSAALAAGATHALDPSGGDVARAVLDLTSGQGGDVVIDTVGNDRTPDHGIRMVRPQGRVVLVGYTDRPALLDVARIVTREARILGSVGATLADAHEAVRLADAGLLRVPIAGTLALSGVNEALERLRAGAVVGRLVLTP